jgi:plastocyanin
MRIFVPMLVAIPGLVGLVGAAVFVLENQHAAEAQATANVSIGDNWFCDPSFADGICDTNITVGDSVLWTNTGTNAHTVTECADAFAPCPQPGGFDSGTLTNGQTFTRVFPTAGTYEYWCNIHGTVMRGRVIVAPAAQQTATPTAGPTAAPGTTTSPTPTRTAGAASPGGVPGSGGTAADGGVSTVAILGFLGGAFLLAAAGGTLTSLRRR